MYRLEEERDSLLSRFREMRRDSFFLLFPPVIVPVEQSRVSRACIATEFLKDERKQGEAGVFLSAAPFYRKPKQLLREATRSCVR